jgi:hypothetical protein
MSYLGILVMCGALLVGCGPSQYEQCKTAADEESDAEYRQRALDRCEQVGDREQRDREARAENWRKSFVPDDEDD